MKKIKNRGSVSSKQLFLLMGLTIVLSVAVSLATISFTGDTVYAWNDIAGGFITGDSQTQTVQESAEAQQTNQVLTAQQLSNIETKQLIADMFNSAFVTSGKTGDWTCDDRCVDSNKECAVAVYAPQNENPYLIGCSDKKVSSKFSTLSCVCVDPNN